MNLLSGVSDFFGLDIGTTAIRLVQLSGAGPAKSLVKYAYIPIDANLSQSDSKVDQQKLAQSISELITQARMNTKNVTVGIPSQRVFTTVVDIDTVPKNELAKTIHYQADSLIPTPLNESKLDWALIGPSPKDKTKSEIILSSIPNNFVEQRLDILEGIGLNVIAFEPNSLALTRSIVPSDNTQPLMVLDVSSRNTDLVITMNGMPRLTRSIPTGGQSIVRTAAQNLNIDETQAEQFVFKFGLNKDKLEGQVYHAIIGAIDLLTVEIDKSIKFFQARYVDIKLDHMIVTGSAAILPGFPLYLANKFGMNVEIGNAWRNVAYNNDRQNELAAVSNQFSVAVGLAERTE